MGDAIELLKQSTPNEMITKLVKAGYLQPAQCDDAGAITSAIIQMRQDLRGSAAGDAVRKSTNQLPDRERASDAAAGATRDRGAGSIPLPAGSDH
jgi:hypothetical protein